MIIISFCLSHDFCLKMQLFSVKVSHYIKVVPLYCSLKVLNCVKRKKINPKNNERTTHATILKSCLRLGHRKPKSNYFYLYHFQIMISFVF